MPLNAVWCGSPTRVFAVGSYTVVGYDGATWTDQSPISGGNFTATWGSSTNNDLFVVGILGFFDRAVIYHRSF